MALTDRIKAAFGAVFGRPAQARTTQADASRIAAGFDLTKNSAQWDKHFRDADAMSAAAQMNPQARRILRQRCRYEVANNSYASGMESTMVKDTIGTGPSVNIPTEANDADAAAEVEMKFREWMTLNGIIDKAQQCCRAEFHDGEGFAIMGTNNRSTYPVKLAVRTFESEMVSNQDGMAGTLVSLSGNTLDLADGIKYDEWGNPTAYYILDKHPGDGTFFVESTAGKWHDAKFVMHLFQKTRAGQVRGIPMVTQGIPLFALIRRYSLACVTGAENIANVNMFLKSAYQMTADDAATVKDWEQLEIARGGMWTLPEGWEVEQPDSPAALANFKEFRREIITEAARGFDMPANIALSTSEGYNYASGRMDYLVWLRSIKTARLRYEDGFFNPIFQAWKAEAILVHGYLSRGANALLRRNDTKPNWVWPAFAQIDSQKEATASIKRLQGGVSSLAYEVNYMGTGQDWRQVMRQREQEKKAFEAAGLVYPGEETLPAPAEGTEPADPASGEPPAA